MYYTRGVGRDCTLASRRGLDRYGTLGVGGGSYIYAGAGGVAAEQIPPYAYSVPYLSRGSERILEE